MLPYCNPLLRALLYPEMQGMERMKTYGNSMIEMLLLFPGTVSSPMFELPIWLSDNGGPQLMSCAPFADMRMNVDALTHVFYYRQPEAHTVDPVPIFPGPHGPTWWEHKFSRWFSTPYRKKWRSTALPLCFWWCRFPKGL